MPVASATFGWETTVTEIQVTAGDLQWCWSRASANMLYHFTNISRLRSAEKGEPKYIANRVNIPNQANQHCLYCASVALVNVVNDI